jgi:hypothetical protein
VLKIGILCDGPHCSKYIRDLVTWASSEGDLEVSHLVIVNQRRVRKPLLSRIMGIVRKQGLERALGGIALDLIVRFEALMLRRNERHGDHLEVSDLTELVGQCVEISPSISPSGLVFRATEEDLEKIRAAGVDLLIRGGSGILRGGILDVCRFGVLSFHHADNRVNRGGPPGFWECYERLPQSGFIIQRLTNELDGGQVLARGGLPTQYYYLLNQANLFLEANRYLKDLLGYIAREGKLPRPERSVNVYSNRLFRGPLLRQAVGYAARLLSRLLVRRLRSLARIEPRWSISFLRSGFDNLALWRAEPVSSPPGRFWADPFLWKTEEASYCLVEDYVYEAGRGHITALEYRKGEVKELGIALKEPFHLSFPFLFSYRGEVFLCPESHATREIRLYSSDDFPTGWSYKMTLMRNVSAVDTMLFEHAGRWWMLTNLDRTGSDEHCTELWLFHSDSPLSSSWTPHPANPVKIDSLGARNAGMHMEKGELHRFGQRQGFDQYGEGLAIYRIDKLTPEEYEEVEVARLSSRFSAGMVGTHHLSCIDDLTVVDHVRWSRIGSR